MEIKICSFFVLFLSPVFFTYLYLLCNDDFVAFSLYDDERNLPTYLPNKSNLGSLCYIYFLIVRFSSFLFSTSQISSGTYIKFMILVIQCVKMHFFGVTCHCLEKQPPEMFYKKKCS